MKDYPMISVIIPVYNAIGTVERACRSVWAQTYPNVELVVVDDGSTDGTAELMDTLVAGREQVQVIHQPNGGVCRARNAGLDAAGGELIFFLDADDALIPQALTSLRKIQQETSADVVASSCLRVRPDGSSFESLYGLGENTLVWRGLEPLTQSLKDHPATYAVWGKLYRREIIGNHRFPEGRKIHEDSFFLFTLFQQELTMVVTDLVTVRYYLTANSASRSVFSEKHLDILYFAGEKQRIVKENHPEFLDLAQNMQVKACLALLKLLSRGCPKAYRGVQRQCQQTIRENAAYFIPAIRVDKVLFWVVQLRLFWLYQLCYRLLKGRK